MAAKHHEVPVLSKPYTSQKIKLSLCLITYRAKKMYGEWRYSSTILVLGTSWRRALSPGSFISGEREVGAHCTGSTLSPRVGLDDVEYRKQFLLLMGMENFPILSL
jgi:hypothetical protein